MDVNSLPKTVTRQHRNFDLNPGPSAPESSMLTTRLPSHPMLQKSGSRFTKYLTVYHTINFSSIIGSTYDSDLNGLSSFLGYRQLVYEHYLRRSDDFPSEP